MPTLLNDYNMVLALSQNTINNQFFLLMQEGTIGDTIDIAYAPATNPKLILNAKVTAPTVEMVLVPANQYQVAFNVNFASGTFTYMDFIKDPKNPQSADVTGWVITLLVNLQKMTIDSADPTGFKLSEAAQTAVSKYVSDSAFTLETLFLDFDNVNMSTAVITTQGVKMQPNDPRYPWVLAALQQLIAHLQADGNPYILGFHASSNDPAQTNPQLPALAPTRIQFISNQYNYSGKRDGSDDGLSSLCYLAMTGTNPFPYPRDKVPAFTWNQIPSPDVQGRMFIDHGTFNSGYIHDTVLPVLSNALQVAPNWAQTGDRWTLDYKWDNGNQNDGHGPVVGSDSGILDIYGKTSKETYCQIVLDVPKSTANKLVYDGTGFFYENLDLYERPFSIWVEDAWVSTKLPFTFSLTLSAGANGTLTATFTQAAGASQQDSWENPIVKITDAIAGLFNASLQKQLNSLSASWSRFQDAEFSGFTNAATQGFQGLSQQLILPAPQTFYYSNIGLNSENDVVLDIGVK